MPITYHSGGDEWKTAFNMPLINNVLRHMLNKYVFVYLDDILIYIGPRRNTYITCRLFITCWRTHFSLRQRSVIFMPRPSPSWVTSSHGDGSCQSLCHHLLAHIRLLETAIKGSWSLQTSIEGSSGDTALWLLHSPLSPPPPRYPSVGSKQLMRHSSILRSDSLLFPSSWFLTLLGNS